MSGANDREEIRAFLDEQFAMVEENGAVALVGLVHHAHSGPAEMHMMKAGGAKWGNLEHMAATLDALATRHARGIVGGGAQQYEISIVRGTDGRASAVLPFVRVGAPNLLGPGGSIATEPPTPTGLTQQAQRWGEQVTQMAFSGIQHLLGTQQRALDSAYAKIETGEKTNAELWLALKGVLMELMKEKHADKMRELMAARMSEFAKQVMTLAPAILNMMADREVFPLATADTATLDTIASVASQEDLRALTSVLMTKGDAGKGLATILTSRFHAYHKRMQDEAAAEKRLIAGLPSRSYEEAERDAAGEAMRALRGGGGAPPSNGNANGNGEVNAAIKALTSGQAGGEETGTSSNPSPSSAPSSAEDRKLWDDLFAHVPAGMVDMLASTLGAENPTLADRIRARAAVAKTAGQ